MVGVVFGCGVGLPAGDFAGVACGAGVCDVCGCGVLFGTTVGSTTFAAGVFELRGVGVVFTFAFAFGFAGGTTI